MLQGNRLACPGLADNGQGLPLVNLQGETLEDLVHPKSLVDLLQNDAHSNIADQKVSKTRMTMLLITPTLVPAISPPKKRPRPG